VVYIVHNCPECGVDEVLFGGMGIASRSHDGYECSGGACEGRPSMGGLVAWGAALVCGSS